MKCYGCCRCQKEHMESEPLFEEHIMWQSKHGIYEVPVDVAIRAAMVQLEMKEREEKEAKQVEDSPPNQSRWRERGQG